MCYSKGGGRDVVVVVGMMVVAVVLERLSRGRGMKGKEEGSSNSNGMGKDFEEGKGKCIRGR